MNVHDGIALGPARAKAFGRALETILAALEDPGELR